MTDVDAFLIVLYSGGLAVLAGWLTIAHTAARWWATLPLVAGTAGMAGVALGALWTGEWLLLACAAMFAVLPAIVWSVRGTIRTGRAGWFHRMVMRYLVMGRSSAPFGGRWQSMTQLRAEYGQSVLDDATRDPELDQVLTETADCLGVQMRRDRNPLVPVEARILSYGNAVLGVLSEPPERIAQSLREHPADPAREDMVIPRYRGYSPAMLTIASLCRLHDSLRVGYVGR